MTHLGRSRNLDGKRFALVLGTAAVVLAAAGCGDDGGDAAAGGKSFTVAVIEPDLTTAPILAALDTLRGDGYDVKTVELAEPELAIEGLAKGEYAISAESTSPALIAAQQGAPIKIIADVVANQWAFYAAAGITSCDDLVGKPVGIFSEGSVATAMIRSWVGENCTKGEPKYLVIGGSDVRAQALQHGEIVATALEIADVATLAEQGEPVQPPLVDFAEALPGVHPQSVYANSEFLTSNSEAAQAFVNALASEHKKINEDSQYLVSLVGKYLPESESEGLGATAKGYVDKGLFDATGLDKQAMQQTIDFFVGAGVIKSGLSVDDAADLRFSDAARS